MTAEIVNIRDYRRKEDTAPSEIVPFEGAGIDGMTFHIHGNAYEASKKFEAPERDGA